MGVRGRDPEPRTLDIPLSGGLVQAHFSKGRAGLLGLVLPSWI